MQAPIGHLDLGCDTQLDTSQNTEATLTCYSLHSYVGTIFSHHNLLAWQLLPKWQGNRKQSTMQSPHPVSVQLHRLGNLCHRWELPQVSFLSWHIMSHVCHDKTHLLSRQAHVCRDKSMLVLTKLLSWQNYVCCDWYLLRQKFRRDKHIYMFLTTNIILLRQAYFCCNKKHVFVATKVLSQQKWYLWQLPPTIDLQGVQLRECYKNNRHFKTKPLSQVVFDLLYLLDSTRFEKANPFNSTPSLPLPSFKIFF